MSSDNAPARGRFITVEGLDGAGKSTQFELMDSLLKSHGIKVTSTREPGGTALGEKLREALLHAKDLDISPRAETLTMFAARAQHIDTVIMPALARGDWVLCDRFTDATYAYQGAGRELGFNEVEALEQWTQGDLRPDLTLFFDVDQTTADSRMGSGPRDRFESESDAFRRRVREGYADLVRRFPNRVNRIDASGGVDEVAALVRGVIEKFVQANT